MIAEDKPYSHGFPRYVPPGPQVTSTRPHTSHIPRFTPFLDVPANMPRQIGKENEVNEPPLWFLKISSPPSRFTREFIMSPARCVLYLGPTPADRPLA